MLLTVKMCVWNLQRHTGWTWGGGNLSSMSASVSLLGDSGWLIHIQNVLAGAAWIAARVAVESASVLVHCRLAISYITNQLFTRIPVSLFVTRLRCICLKRKILQL